MTGLKQEARIAAGPGLTVICSSSDPKQLRVMLAGFDPTTIRGVVSFGVAGDRRWLAALEFSEELLDDVGLNGRRVVRGGLVGVEQVVAARAAKAALHSKTGAAAVDMESHIAAAYAHEASLPFAALRVVSDPANRALPSVVSTAIKPNGGIDLRKVLRGVARNPSSIKGLVSTGIDFNRALRSLRGCRGLMLDVGGLVTANL